MPHQTIKDKKIEWGFKTLIFASSQRKWFRAKIILNLLHLLDCSQSKKEASYFIKIIVEKLEKFLTIILIVNY